MALLLMWMLETMQFSPMIIHGLGVLLIAARLLHLHGLTEPSGNGLAASSAHVDLGAYHCLRRLAFAGAFGLIF